MSCFSLKNARLIKHRRNVRSWIANSRRLWEKRSLRQSQYVNIAVDEISKREHLPIGIMIRFGETVRTEQFAFRTVLFAFFLSSFPSFYALIYYWFTNRILSTFLVREGQRMFFTTKVNEKLRRNSRKLFIIRFNVTAKTWADFSYKRCNIKSLKPAAQQNNMIQSYKCDQQLRKRTSAFHRNEMKDKKTMTSACSFGNVDFLKYSLTVENFNLYPTKMNGSISDFA